MKKTLQFFLCFAFIGLFAIATGLSCKKSDDSIPNVAVNIRISITDPNYAVLNAVGGWVYVTGGVKGIVIYCRAVNEFMAYERNCSYHPNESNAKVDVDASNNLFLNDASCGSKFLITDGSVQHGPASSPLKHYNTSFDGNYINVYN